MNERTVSVADLGLWPIPRSTLEPEGLLNRLERVSAAFHLDSLRPQIAACRGILRDQGVVNVAVVGRFKAGKSSLLNFIAGRAVLPVDVLPATAVITTLNYGPVERARLRFLDGRSEEIPLERLAEFVTERGNPGNARQLAVADVELPSLAAYQGIRFVDTPGLGSAHVHNTRTAREWLPEIGAALVATGIDQPLSEDDLTLLVELERFTPETIVVLTKIDLAQNGQLERVTAFVREQLVQRLGREPRVLPFSVRPGFDSAQELVRKYLRQHVAGRHEERAREILVHKLRMLASDARDYLSVAHAAAEAGEKAQTDLEVLLNEERRDLDQVRREVRLLAGDYEARAREASRRGFVTLGPDLTARVVANFDERSREWRGNLAKTSAAYSQWVAEVLAQELGAASPQGEEFLGELVTQAEAGFVRVVRAFQDRLTLHIERALETSFGGVRFEVTLPQLSHPDVRVDRAFDVPLDLLWFLVPMPIFRRLIYRRLRGQLAWEVEKNLARLAVGWADAMVVTVADVAEQARLFIEQELATLDELLAHSVDKRPQVEEALRELQLIDTSLRGDNGESAAAR
ncbi:MAG: dynamin family protein [Actinobacteria bacterium]|nr:dynamin family protein [Actinomycetota bacterium]